MKIYTRRGDEGQTDLFGGPRVGKDHLRVEAYGAVDELNAVLGQAAAASEQADLQALGQQSDSESVSTIAGLVFVLMPDFEVFNKTLEAVHGLPIARAEVGLGILYALGYTVCTLMLGSMIFSRRDFK